MMVMDDIFHYQPPKAPLDILYQDKDVVVVSKPSGLLSVPGRGDERSDSMLNRLKEQFPTALVVHRLDMDTSGLMIFALRKKAEKHLKEQFRKRSIRKKYTTLVQGIMITQTGSITSPLAPDPTRPLRHCVSQNGKPSHTNYTVLEVGTDCSLLMLEPITGRSHQLRVHLLSIGHPILGDRFYGTKQTKQRATRLMLHANEVSFHQPYSNEFLSFSKPSGFTVLYKKL
jgi:tRNA pseudouridine32 synthase / 23S rRNA pseudouridine746 synthase